MVLSTWHKQRGDEVVLTQNLNVLPDWTPDRVYASSLFTFSAIRREQIKAMYPDALVGGDGYFPVRSRTDFVSNLNSVIDVDADSVPLDYSPYPQFTASLGYSQRGCRLNCAFCLMQTREGKVRNVSVLSSIWRGEPWPKHIHLLDNDFFGQSQWRELLNEAIERNFKVCFNQGINIRLINEEQAQMLARVRYYDDSFTARRLYTAWDNLGDELVFKRGIRIIIEAGVPAHRIMVYMLLGFREGETEEEVLYRYNEMVKLGVKPYPMVFDRSRLLLCRFQKWVIRRYCEVCTWDEFKAHHKSQPQWDEHVDYHRRSNYQ